MLLLGFATHFPRFFQPGDPDNPGCKVTATAPAPKAASAPPVTTAPAPKAAFWPLEGNWALSRGSPIGGVHKREDPLPKKMNKEINYFFLFFSGVRSS